MAIKVSIFLVEQETVTAIWCPKCLKPSGIEVRFASLWLTGVTPNAVRLRKCRDCDAPLPLDGASG